MKEYIEKEAFMQYLLDLKKQVNEIMPGQSVISGTTLSELIDRFPAADVVEVVLCKECKHGRPYKHTKEYVACEVDCEPIDRDSDFYCADAERRTDGRD